MKSGTAKRATHVESSGPVLRWSKPPRQFRWLPWQDIVALLGFAVAVGVFVFLFLWGLSSGAFHG